MKQATLPLLAGWANFYVIIGSSAGALTGLQFVVMTLIAEAQAESSMREVRALYADRRPFPMVAADSVSVHDCCHYPSISLCGDSQFLGYGHLHNGAAAAR